MKMEEGRLIVSPREYAFTAVVGYEPVEPIGFTVINEGAEFAAGLEITMEEEEMAFFWLSRPSGETEIDPGKSIRFSVYPRDGLGAGEYLARILVRVQGAKPVPVALRFTVQP